MKNRVLRLAVVAMLVVAMTLTMAACAAPAVPQVEAPVAPQAPAPAPVEDVKAPVVAPAPVEDTDDAVDAPAAAPSAEDALKADYGITVTATNKTYGAKKQNGDPDLATIVVKIPKGFDTTRYTLSFDVEPVDYEGLNKQNTRTKEFIKNALENNESTDRKDGGTLRTVTFEDAGTYTVEFTISIQPEEVKFGFFGIPKAEDPDEYTITKTVEVAKKAVEITIEDNFQPVAGATAEEIDADIFAVTGLDGVGDFTLKFSDNNAKDELRAALDGIFYVSVPAYDPKVPGVITVSLVYAEAGYKDEDDLLDFAEVLEEVANYTFTLGTGTINILSSYEWNEVGDVLTSVLDIPAAADDAAIAAHDQYALALKRYEALNDAQLVFLKNIDNIEAATLKFASKVEIAASGKAYNETDVEDAAKGATLVKWLAEDIKKAYDAKIAKDANIKIWEDVVKAAEWETYGEKFNVNNEFAMASFNVIDAFVKANSAVLKNLGFVNKYTGAFVTGKDNDFDKYLAAIAKISEAKINATLELIKGAEAAYIKAKAHADVNSDLLLYKNAAGLYYIDNEEVDLLVKYALDAYNALTKAEKGTVDGDASTAVVKSLAQMSKVVDSMKEITEYVKIANYHAKVSDIYAILRNLVYGDAVKAGEADFFGRTDAAKKHYALADLDKYFADDEVRAAVVAEYKAWIDVVVAFEEVKEAAVDAFDVAFNEYCVDEELKAEEIEKSKDAYAGIVAKIMKGEEFEGIEYSTVTEIIVAEEPETIDEVKEYFEDAFDADKIADQITFVGGNWVVA